MKKALLFLTDGFEEVEAITTADILIRGEVSVSIVSLNGRQIVEGSHGIKVTADILFNEIWEPADCLVLPGGPGVANYHQAEGFAGFVKKYYENGCLISAICAAPTFLAKIGILEGKKAVCFPGMENLMGNSLAGESPVTKDTNIITAKSAAVTPCFAFSILEELMGNEMADKVYAQMHFELLE